MRRSSQSKARAQDSVTFRASRTKCEWLKVRIVSKLSLTSRLVDINIMIDLIGLSPRIRRCHRNDRRQGLRSQVPAVSDQRHPIRTTGHRHEESGGAARDGEQGRGQVRNEIRHGTGRRRRSRTTLLREASVLVQILSATSGSYKRPKDKFLIHA